MSFPSDSLSCCHTLSLSLAPPLTDGQYKYRKQLDSCSLSSSSALPQFLCKIVTPLKLVRWQEWLEHHPDKLFVEYMLRGIKEDFRLGCDTTSIRLKSCDSNMASAAEHAEVVSKYLGDKLVAQRIIKVGL